VNDAPSASPRLARVAWAFVGYLLLVILFGAWVRITGSGAGCGQHWPLCNGEVLPPSPSTATRIEFTHRITSGMCGIFAVAVLAAAGRLRGPRSPATRAAAATLLFVIGEGAIGAGLVLGELVEDDASIARAVVISLHLSNTLLLMASASLTAWFAGGGRGRRPGGAGWAAGAALVVTAMTGAVTALGDTIFPVGSAAALGAADHFLVQLRIVHPALAVGAALVVARYALVLGRRASEAGSRRWAKALLHLVGAQVVIGGLNIALAAPGATQLLHLGMAQAVWIAFVVATAGDER
jgi:cytochrome c oxidase assembly protein subunit 15